MSKGKWITLAIVLSISFLVFGAFAMSRALEHAKEAQSYDVLRAWEVAAEEKDQERIASYRERLDRDQVKLDEDEIREASALAIQMDREAIRDDRRSIRTAEDWLKTCSELVRAELEVAAHNSEDRAHLEAEPSGIRKDMCGGP